jgi:hypothetical protein
LVAWFSTSIPAKKSFTKLFEVTQANDESTRVYLKRFNKEMIKVEELIMLMAFEALINRVRGELCGKSCMLYQIEVC